MVPPATRPGGEYDRYLAGLAAQGRFSGVVLLADRGRTVLSRSYGMADRERGIRNHDGVAVNLSSASQPFLAVAVLQLAQQGKVALSDTVGRHLGGFDAGIAERVTLHHLLTGTSGIDAPMPDWQRVFTSKQEVLDFQRDWARHAVLVGAPGAGDNGHLPGGGAGLSIAAQVVEAVSGMTFWDYVQQNVFRRAGMTGSGYFTRQQWLTDEHIAHSYLRQADGTLVDAVRNLDKGSLDPHIPGRNPARGFIGHASGDGFATAPDLARFATALVDGTLLDRPHADLFTGPKRPGPEPAAFEGYTMPISIVGGNWVVGRGGATAGSAANWNIYLGTGWVGVILANTDDTPFVDICLRETEAVTGVTLTPPGGG